MADDQRDSVDLEIERLAGRTPRRVGKIAAAVAVVATLVAYGVGIGRLMQKVDDHDDDITKLQQAKDAHAERFHTIDTACRERAEKLRDAAHASFGARDRAIGEIQGAIVGLTTEMRVRHGDRSYDAVVQPPTRGRPVTRREREKLAASAADREMRDAIMSHPANADDPDPLAGLSF